LATLEEILGNYKQAEDHYLEARRIYQEQSNYYELAICLRNLGNLQLAKMTPQAALPFFTERLEIVNRHHFSSAIPYALIDLGMAYHHLQDFVKAKKFCESALKHIQDTHLLSHESDILVHLAKTEIALGNYILAQQHLHKSIQFYWQNHTLEHVLECLIYLGELAAKQGRVDKGYLWWQIALQHTTTEPKVKKDIQTLLAYFQDQLSSKQRHTLKRQAKKTNLEDVITEVLWL
jgi:tetratricopeptide (TPR) repeat protein